MEKKQNHTPEDELAAEKLKGVAGGYIVHDDQHNPYSVYEDDTGRITGRFPTLEEAIEYDREINKP